MPNPDDMSKPVTHGELREVLDENRTLIVRELAQLVTHAVKGSEESLRSLVTQEVARSEESLRSFVAQEVAHTVKSSEESLRSYMGALLDKASANDEKLDAKYSDLPARVTRLEAAVFRPKRQRRR